MEYRIGVRGRGPYLVVKITTKCQRPTSHPYKMTPKKMDSFCREGIGQLYKMEGANVTDCYKMGRGLERPTHLVVNLTRKLSRHYGIFIIFPKKSKFQEMASKLLKHQWKTGTEGI